MVDMGQFDAAKPVKGEIDNGIFTRQRERTAKYVAACDLIGAVQTLRAVEAARVRGEMKPVAAGDARSNALRIAISATARYYGVQLKPIPTIDTRGDVSIASAPAKAFEIAGVPFSQGFCDALNKHNPRCGVPGTVAIMDHQSANWCKMNHFDAERMVCEVADAIEAEEKG